MKKRIFSILFIIFLLFTLGLAVSAETFTAGDFEYTVKSDGTAKITDYNGIEGGDLVIPDSVGEYGEYIVTEIGSSVFLYTLADIGKLCDLLQKSCCTFCTFCNLFFGNR